MNLSTSPESALNPAALRRWILAFCIIRFDLEQGQVVEECFPPDSLTPDHQIFVALSSFPDSMSHHHPRHRSSIHDSIFSFRFPSVDTFTYGYVFNRLRQDDRLPRGGEQKSVVILSHSPYTSVFRPLLQILGPLCFDIGRSALELVASHVAAWPSPAPGSAMELPIGGSTLRAFLPPAQFGLFHDADLFASFRGILLHLWTLWELMVIGEPILVVGSTPTQCSEAVVSLVGIVAPLLCSVDFRPYFTIHDPDFARLNSLREGHRFPPMVLGVTNLFFIRALRSIPHVVSVGSSAANSAGVLSASPRLSSTGENSRPGRQLLLDRLSPSSLLNAVKMRREGPLALMRNHREAIWSSYSPTTKPDTAILNRLVDAGVSQRVDESMSVVNNEILRRHFLELTTNFLAPFGPYMRATTPSETSSPFGSPPPLPPFKPDEFLSSLAARGPAKFLSKRTRSNWLDLYRRFLEGKNFMPWFQKRREAAEQEQRHLWRQARISTDIQKLISKMSELEIVDCFNAIETHLLAEIQSANENIDSSATCSKLKADLQAVFKVLPKDLQELLLSTPKRAGLLHGSRSLQSCLGIHRYKMFDKAVKLYAELAEAAVASFLISKDPPVIEPVRIHSGTEENKEALRKSRGEDDEDFQITEYQAQKGNAAAMYRIGLFYYYGLRGVRRDHNKALYWFSKAVEKGEPKAMELLGEIYARGAGVERNYTKALEWLTLASKQQHYSAYNGLGYLYVKGYGVEKKNLTKAREYFEKAAENKEPGGHYNLGVLYLKGIGMKKDITLACKYFLTAANAGQPKALYQVAKLFQKGIGLKKNLPMATYLYKVVAERGPWSSLSRWALESYLKGDIGKALLLYSRMAELGYEVAQSNAAWILDRYGEHSMCIGESGFCTDSERHLRAHSLWWQASEQGNEHAALLIGDAYYYGRGTERDFERAAEAYMHAQSQSNAQAMFNLGYMHEHGEGLPLDLHLAKRYYDQALENDPAANFPVKLALSSLLFRRNYPDSFLIRVIDSLPNVFPRIEVWVEEVLLDEGNATILTLFVCLLTVLYLRERQRRNAVLPPPRQPDDAPN